MKKKIKFQKALRLLVTAIIVMFCMPLSVSAADADIPFLTADPDGVYRYVYKDAETGKEYMLAVFAGLYDSADEIDLE